MGTVIENQTDKLLAPTFIINKGGFYSIPLEENVTAIFVDTLENVNISCVDQNLHKVTFVDDIKTYQLIIGQRDKEFIPKTARVIFNENYYMQSIGLSSFQDVIVDFNIIMVNKNQDSYQYKVQPVGTYIPQEMFILNYTNVEQLNYAFKGFDNFNSIEMESHTSRKLMFGSFAERIQRRESMEDENRMRTETEVEKIFDASATVERGEFYGIREVDPENFNNVNIATPNQYASFSASQGAVTSEKLPQVQELFSAQAAYLPQPLNRMQVEDYAEQQKIFIKYGLLAPIASITLGAMALQTYLILHNYTSHHHNFYSNSTYTSHNFLKNYLDTEKKTNSEDLARLHQQNDKYKDVYFPFEKFGYIQKDIIEHKFNQNQKVIVNHPLIEAYNNPELMPSSENFIDHENCSSYSLEGGIIGSTLTALSLIVGYIGMSYYKSFYQQKGSDGNGPYQNLYEVEM